jgi:hypothetical protein
VSALDPIVTESIEPPTEFFAQLARELGFKHTFYPVERAFREIGIGRAYGWKLVRDGELPTTRLSGRKTIIASVHLARLVWRRQQTPPAESEGGRIARAAATARRQEKIAR